MADVDAATRMRAAVWRALHDIAYMAEREIFLQADRIDSVIASIVSQPPPACEASEPRKRQRIAPAGVCSYCGSDGASPTPPGVLLCRDYISCIERAKLRSRGGTTEHAPVMQHHAAPTCGMHIIRCAFCGEETRLDRLRFGRCSGCGEPLPTPDTTEPAPKETK